MAIAFRSKGTTVAVDTSAGGTGVVPISFPAGHVSGDTLLLFVTTDDNSNVTDLSGWTRLFYITNGSSVSTPYTPRLRTKCFVRQDTGALGSSLNLQADTNPWPTGKPSLLAFMVAYSGCEPTGPVERWDFLSTTATTVIQPHPTETTISANAWLLSFRAVSTDAPGATFTISGGTNTERQDDFDTIPELASALYDAGPLTAGLQTQRLTTASRLATYGGLAASIILKPSGSASATPSAGEVSVLASALDATVTTHNGPWDLCGAGGLPEYTFAIDWAGDGSLSDPGDDVTGKITSDISFSYGRDQARQLNPAAVGSASFSVINVDRTFSPDYAGSILSGDLEPAQRMVGTVDYNGTTYPLTYAKIDDYNLAADMTSRTVDFTFLDGLADLQNFDLSTGVYKSKRTGELIQIILDLVGWTGPVDLDLGATVVPFWWVESTDALNAITDLVKSEGPPAILYQAPDGTIVFRDRHHRLLRSQSRNVQADFSQPKLMDCTVILPGPDDETLDFTAPFTYQHGWRDIVNSVSFDVSERLEDSGLTAVWTQSDQIPISNGQSVTIEVSGSDPFLDAVVPVQGTDFEVSGAGVVVATLSRDSGQSVTLTLLASGGAVNVSALQLRAKAITVQRTIKVSRVDADSITRHGTKSYPDSAPWANKNDADAIAGMILLQYARRRPTIQLRVTTADPAHFLQVMNRTVSDRIHVKYDEVGLDNDFFVESVQHTVQRINQTGLPPVHAVVLGCEKDFDLVANPFTFDQRGSGFDDGVFDPIQSDQPDTVFRFDDPVQGLFDSGKYGT